MVSLLGHVSIVAFFLARAIVFKDSHFDSLPAIRVDIVGLPEKNAALPPPLQPDKPETKLPPKAEPPPSPSAPAVEDVKPKVDPLPEKKDAISLDKTKNKQKEALERLKKMQALDRIRNDVETEAKETRREQLLAQAAKVRGNQIAPGTELVGIEKLQHEDYRNALDRHIKPHWQLPEWLATKGYTALVLIRIDQQGRLISKQLMKTSGSTDYDTSVLDTVERAAPYPAPPEKFTAKAAVDGVLLEFGSETK